MGIVKERVEENGVPALKLRLSVYTKCVHAVFLGLCEACLVGVLWCLLFNPNGVMDFLLLTLTYHNINHALVLIALICFVVACMPLFAWQAVRLWNEIVISPEGVRIYRFHRLVKQLD